MLELELEYNLGWAMVLIQYEERKRLSGLWRERLSCGPWTMGCE